MADAGFPKEATIRIFDSPTELDSSSGRLNSNPFDASIYVFNFQEEGFKNNISHVKTMGANHRTVANGRTDITITFDVRVVEDDVIWAEIFNQRSGFSVQDDFGELTRKFYLEVNFTGINREIEYYNMVPVSFVERARVDGILEATVTFIAPAWDVTNSRWNKKVL